MTLLILLFWSSLQSLGDTTIKEVRLSMEELESLAGKHQWMEVLQSARLVLPSKRNPHWMTLVETAAVEYMDEKSKQGMSRLDKVADPILTDYPQLNHSKKFMEKRRAFGLEGFKQCFQNAEGSENCTEDFLRYMKADRDSLVGVKSAALLVREKKPSSALRFWDLYYEYGSASQICSDDDFQAAWLDALLDEEGKALQIAKKMAQGPCWKAFQSKVETAFNDDKKGEILTENLCPLEKRIRGLASSITARCRSLKPPDAAPALNAPSK